MVLGEASSLRTPPLDETLHGACVFWFQLQELNNIHIQVMNISKLTINIHT